MLAVAGTDLTALGLVIDVRGMDVEVNHACSASA